MRFLMFLGASLAAVLSYIVTIVPFYVIKCFELLSIQWIRTVLKQYHASSACVVIVPIHLVILHIISGMGLFFDLVGTE